MAVGPQTGVPSARHPWGLPWPWGRRPGTGWQAIQPAGRPGHPLGQLVLLVRLPVLMLLVVRLLLLLVMVMVMLGLWLLLQCLQVLPLLQQRCMLLLQRGRPRVPVGGNQVVHVAVPCRVILLPRPVVAVSPKAPRATGCTCSSPHATSAPGRDGGGWWVNGRPEDCSGGTPLRGRGVRHPVVAHHTTTAHA